MIAKIRSPGSLELAFRASKLHFSVLVDSRLWMLLFSRLVQRMYLARL